jgi:hypothetical protein
MRMWALKRLALKKKSRGFYCRHNGFWHCDNDGEKHGFWTRSLLHLAGATF